MCSVPFVEPAPPKPAAKERGDYCPRCYSPAVDVVGKFGPFVGCSSFPRCAWATSEKWPGRRPLTQDDLERDGTDSDGDWFGGWYPSCSDDM